LVKISDRFMAYNLNQTCNLGHAVQPNLNQTCNLGLLWKSL